MIIQTLNEAVLAYTEEGINFETFYNIYKDNCSPKFIVINAFEQINVWYLYHPSIATLDRANTDKILEFVELNRTFAYKEDIRGEKKLMLIDETLLLFLKLSYIKLFGI